MLFLLSTLKVKVNLGEDGSEGVDAGVERGRHQAHLIRPVSRE